jgi:hypothetical protein
MILFFLENNLSSALDHSVQLFAGSLLCALRPMTIPATRRRQWVAAGLVVVAVAAVAGLIGGLWSPSASSMNTNAAAQDKTDQSKDGPQPVDTLATGAVVVPKSKNGMSGEMNTTGRRS